MPGAYEIERVWQRPERPSWAPPIPPRVARGRAGLIHRLAPAAQIVGDMAEEAVDIVGRRLRDDVEVG